MKVFLSHRMSDVTEEYVHAIRKEAQAYITKKYKEDNIDIIDNYYHEDAPVDAGRLWHLGRSIQQMQDADIVVFIDDGVESAKGCIIEKTICVLYDIKYITCTIKNVTM